MDGKVCVVTGANSGIGKVISAELARQGATVVMVCRNKEKALASKEEIERGAAHPERVALVLADLSLQREVRRAASEILALHPRIDVLLNNAGLYIPKRIVTDEGFEFMLATNHLAPFLLTHLLRDALAKAAPSRIITTTSDAHFFGGGVLWDDLNYEKRFIGLRQYCKTKLYNILFTRALARRVAASGISANCFHPGMVRSGFAQDLPGFYGTLVKVGWPFMRSVKSGAKSGIWLATAPEGQTLQGAFVVHRRVRFASPNANNQADAERLWDLTAKLVGVSPDAAA